MGAYVIAGIGAVGFFSGICAIICILLEALEKEEKKEEDTK